MEPFSPVFERWMDVSYVLAFVFGCCALFSPILFMIENRRAAVAGAGIIALSVTLVVYRTACYVLYGL